MLKHPLDNPRTFARLDTHHVYDSIVQFPDQVNRSWTDISYSTKLDRCPTASNIVISGMGGSALGGRIIQSLSQFLLLAPLEIINNYRLPAYVNEKSLVVLSSYSGDTEETLSCAKDALKRKAQIFVISTGGKLAELAAHYHLPSYIFKPLANPSCQPRLGLGYSITATLALLAHCRFVSFTAQDVESIVSLLHQSTSNLQRENPVKTNPAKTLALKLKDKAILIVSANHLTGTAHAIKNMLNENAKTFSVSFDLPELNHHLLEGLSLPHGLKDNFHILILNSDLYPEAISKRLHITRDVFNKIGYPTTVIKPDSREPILQVFETLYFGEFLSLYLSLLSNIDPGPIPWVNYFKEALEKAKHRI